jgi:hypothetical protein
MSKFKNIDIRCKSHLDLIYGISTLHVRTYAKAKGRLLVGFVVGEIRKHSTSCT